MQSQALSTSTNIYIYGWRFVRCKYDLSRAFDTLSFRFIIDKLYNTGLRGVFLNWIDRYLRERTMLLGLAIRVLMSLASIWEFRMVPLWVLSYLFFSWMIHLTVWQDSSYNIRTWYIGGGCCGHPLSTFIVVPDFSEYNFEMVSGKCVNCKYIVDLMR